MKSSDELMNAAEEKIDSNDLKASADEFLDRLKMEQLLKQWSSVRRSKHNTARAQRAKARINKRKSKR